MSKIRGFMTYRRVPARKEPAEQRIRHSKEFEATYNEEITREQAARCMDCGIPFCHGDTGCPVENLIPEFNDLAYRGLWREALDNLHSTNNFPEFTGRLCPAPCETACTLGITDPAVTIKNIERAIVDYGFREGWVEPQPPHELSGKTVAIIGSGPAGLACAQQLARAGHTVTVFEREDRIGGLLRYGIPDFKMEKWHIDRRLQQMKQEGVRFRTSCEVGKDIPAKQIMDEFDAMVLAIGAEDPIPLDIPGSDLDGVHFAMDFLVQDNRVVAGDSVPDQLKATDKHVIVIGGGDTGSDCIGVSHRHGAKSVFSFRRSQKPPEDRPAHQPWPLYPDLFYETSSHEEGGERFFSVRPVRLEGEKGRVKRIVVHEVERGPDGRFQDIANGEKVWDADLVLLAMGYMGPFRNGLVDELVQAGLELDKWGNVKSPFGNEPGSFATNLPGVYSCGDARRGQSLIVWAISEGRKCAAEVHRSFLPRPTARRLS